MNLTHVTLTGADDSVDPDALAEISQQYPLVEWGILIGSLHNEGTPRFPSKSWLEDFEDAQKCEEEMQCSLHLCGRWLRDLLRGDRVCWDEMPFSRAYGEFQRVQLNFHGEAHETNGREFRRTLASLPQKTFIFQIDGYTGPRMLENYLSLWPNGVPLYDLSHGAGVVPEIWPEPEWNDENLSLIPHGYAGGIGPDNVADVLKQLSPIVEDCPVWIDMETKLRSDNGEQFDLDKCRRVLEIVSEFQTVTAG